MTELESLKIKLQYAETYGRDKDAEIVEKDSAIKAQSAALEELMIWLIAPAVDDETIMSMRALCAEALGLSAKEI